MRGRKPLPSHLRVVTGNRGKRSINEAEPIPVRSIPLPPEELNVDAKAEWERVSEELYRLGVLTGIDRAALAAYCQAYGRWAQAERALSKFGERGLLMRTTNDNWIQNPLIGIANKAMADMVRYAAEFGMTPSARSRIKADAPRDEEDRAERYFTA